MSFFFEVLINGLLVGVMYSLVAMGFALIYKASDVFNFAQGDFSLFAGLALVGFLTVMPVWLAIICTIGVMSSLSAIVLRAMRICASPLRPAWEPVTSLFAVMSRSSWTETIRSWTTLPRWSFTAGGMV